MIGIWHTNLDAHRARSWVEGGRHARNVALPNPTAVLSNRNLSGQPPREARNQALRNLDEGAHGVEGRELEEVLPGPCSDQLAANDTSLRDRSVERRDHAREQLELL